MDDIFDQSAEVRPHVDIHKLLYENKAELNSLEKNDDDSIATRREIGRKYKIVVEALGRGGIAQAAKQGKVAECVVRRHIELHESPECISREEAMAIVHGHKARVKAQKEKTTKPARNPSHDKLWRSVNGVRNWSKSLAEHLQKPDDFEFIDKHLKVIEKRINEMEKAGGQ